MSFLDTIIGWFSKPTPEVTEFKQEFIGTYSGSKVYKTAPNKVEWTGKADVDGDGSPRCYHPNSAKGLDALANAGSAGNWYGIVTDNGKPTGRPIIQGPNDPCPGFYVSPTSLIADHNRPESDPRRYFDSESVNYVVVPENFPIRLLGNRCRVTYNGRESIGIVAEVGPPHKIGEISIAMAKELGIPASPRTGGVQDGVHYAVFI